MIQKELLDVLACPKCRQDVRLSKDGKYIICDKCKLLYEIKDNVPVMLIDTAISTDNTENL
ncbi:MAG: Trm112 family protein [Clostridia bacterium]|nr:Trm112 family protein [Deferribacterales bacterium]MBQ7076257.1 Trm112 family protein [Clostridia bacterium]